MSSVMDLIKETMLLTQSVGELKAETSRLATKVDEHSERIVKLETREDFLQEKMANTAIKAVNEMNGKLVERISNLEYTAGFKKVPGKE